MHDTRSLTPARYHHYHRLPVGVLAQALGYAVLSRQWFAYTSVHLIVIESRSMAGYYFSTGVRLEDDDWCYAMMSVGVGRYRCHRKRAPICHFEVPMTD